MRVSRLPSVASWALAWIAALSLAAPMAAAQDENATVLAAAEARERVPLAAVRGEERCKLIVAKGGEDPTVVEEKTPEKGREFVFLEDQGTLLPEFQVPPQDHRECGMAFGLVSAGGAGGLATATAVGIGTVGIAAGITAAAAAAAVVGAAALAAQQDPTPATSTE